MAQFKADIQGNRGKVSRLGTKASGIKVHLNGWSVGCFVVLEHRDGRDVLRVFRTCGSNDSDPRELLVEIREGDKTLFNIRGDNMR